MPPLPTIFLILAAVSSGAAVIAILVALRSSREARSAIFPIVKEEEMIKARRARISIVVWLALTALFLGGWLATLQWISPPTQTPVAGTTHTGSPTVMPAVEEAATTFPEISPTVATVNTPLASTETSESALLPTATPTPALLPTATLRPPTPTALATPPPPTPTPSATPTSTPPPTSTPSPSPTPLLKAPPASRTPAPPGVRVGPIKFGTEITDKFEVADPARLFPAGIRRIYASYPFHGMQKGLKFTAVWYRNGVEIARDETEWSYGQVGVSYSFMIPPGPGLYKLELYVNDTVVATSLFEIR